MIIEGYTPNFINFGRSAAEQSLIEKAQNSDFWPLLLIANGSETLDHATSNGRSSAAERPKLMKFGV